MTTRTVRPFPASARILSLLLLISAWPIGCGSDDQDGSPESGSEDTGVDDLGSAGSDGGSDASDDQPPDAFVPFEGAPLAPLSTGDCPDLTQSGVTTFISGELSRRVVVQLPETIRPGLPALTVWHGLGDSAESMSTWMFVSELARANDLIVVVPDSVDRAGMTWDIFTGSDRDLVLYDDIRTCLSMNLEIDLSRYYATGFSFGGFMTTYLTMHRADTLAATAVLSGGISPYLPYTSPDWSLPVLVMWGGERDVYGSGASLVEFESTSTAFSDALGDDGHVVVHCDHGGGHTVPLGIHGVLEGWFLPHQFGRTSPFRASPLTGFPAYCSTP